MADSPFETAAKAALVPLYAQFGKSVTYARPSTGYSVSLTMLPPGANLQIVTADGVRARSTGGEFICKKADLVLNAVAVEPARGDTITDASSRQYDVTEWEELVDTAEWRITASEVD